ARLFDFGRRGARLLAPSAPARGHRHARRHRSGRGRTQKALAQMDLRQKITLLIGEWKAAGGGDVLSDVRDRVRLRPVKTAVKPLRVIAGR
ncbi:MAG: hypothetical protein JSV48_07020, partial [Bradyrhizobium sp.]